jgi:hypothetical protein
MKPVIIILLCVVALVLVIFVARTNEQSKYNYTIHYNAARYSTEDFTNEFEYLPGNSSIRYVNEQGDSVYRTGTFSIERNNHFKK